MVCKSSTACTRNKSRFTSKLQRCIMRVSKGDNIGNPKLEVCKKGCGMMRVGGFDVDIDPKLPMQDGPRADLLCLEGEGG